MRAFNTFWGDFFDNLRAGIRLAFFRPIERHDLTGTVGQYAALIALTVAVFVAHEALTTDGPRRFNIVGLYSLIASELIAAGLIAAVWRIGRTFDLARMVVGLSALGLVYALLIFAVLIAFDITIGEDAPSETTDVTAGLGGLIAMCAVLLLFYFTYSVACWGAVKALAEVPRKRLALALSAMTVLAGVALPARPIIYGPSTDWRSGFSIYEAVADWLNGDEPSTADPPKSGGDTI